ncbi:MAG: molecular chaperone DnaJ, partial [Lautropia mirabilis]|nr:molecular chaperone DnaJ [Lautropia mirabilis]
PAGIDDGMRSRAAGNGEPGTNGGPAGDLYVEIRIKEHSVFKRDGDDLHCEVPISMVTAALGGTIQVPTLGGSAEIELPEGVQPGKVFRLRGKGIKGIRAQMPGDLYAHITVEVPVRLTDKQKQMLRELDQSLSDAKHSPQTRSWKDRLKEFFQ